MKVAKEILERFAGYQVPQISWTLDAVGCMANRDVRMVEAEHVMLDVEDVEHQVYVDASSVEEAAPVVQEAHYNSGMDVPEQATLAEYDDWMKITIIRETGASYDPGFVAELYVPASGW